MRKSFGAKAICYPMPVFIIGPYNADGTPNAMNNHYLVLGEQVGQAFREGTALN